MTGRKNRTFGTVHKLLYNKNIDIFPKMGVLKNMKKYSINTVLTSFAMIMAIAIGFFAIHKQIDTLASGSLYATSLSNPSRAVTIYTNRQYNFKISMPENWKNYSIKESEWIGTTINSEGEIPSEKGALIYIRHPLWTEASPRQDIPIMIFTLDQWKNLQANKYHIGAAPIGPMELDRNKDYVFALPARYNFAFLTGYDEVAQILARKPLKAL